MAQFPVLLLFVLAMSLASFALPWVNAGAVEIAPPPDEAETPKRFNFADVHRRAALLAASSFQEDQDTLPDFLRGLNYDQYRDIRFRTEKSLWREERLPFEVQFFSRGSVYLQRVAINVLEDGNVTPVKYSPDLFNFGRNKVPEIIPEDLGFAGFRLHYPINRDDYYDEIAVFLGASYFRAVGNNQHYGISARGLAIDTALPKPEEFPFFREFWLEKPARDATAITLYALLDSPSVTGAYRFVIKPGLGTVMEVKAHLFHRKEVTKLAIAPLTSMFFHGELTERPMDDFRPEVHDSDGLLLALGSGEWLWRPLDNLKRLRSTFFHDSNPRGFGLLQRDRNFDHYQDLEALYQARPSAWIETVGEWGKGVVQLLEIPTDSEFNDNIVAFWIPEAGAKAGQEQVFEYRVHFLRDLADWVQGGQTLATRVGAAGRDESPANRRKFVLDFGGGTLDGLPAETPVEAVVTASKGQIVEPVTQKNPFTGGWRVFFDMIPETDDPIELRCFLRTGQDVLTETWSYQWQKQ